MRGPAPNGITTRLGELIACAALPPPAVQRAGSNCCGAGKLRASTAPGRIRHMISEPAGTSMPATTVSLSASLTISGATGLSRIAS